MGSTTLTLDSTRVGNRVAEIRYKPWGEQRDSYGTTPTQRRFTGRLLDSGTGLYFYNARYYDPTIGRFIQADTLVPEPGNPQSLNRYAYTLNNPLRYTDPSGHCPAPPEDLGSGNIICVAAFIPTEVSAATPGGPFAFLFLGDNRDFSSDSPEDASRFWLWIDAETGEILNPGGKAYVHPTCNTSGGCSAPRDKNNIELRQTFSA